MYRTWDNMQADSPLWCCISAPRPPKSWRVFMYVYTSTLYHVMICVRDMMLEKLSLRSVERMANLGGELKPRQFLQVKPIPAAGSLPAAADARPWPSAAGVKLNKTPPRQRTSPKARQRSNDNNMPEVHVPPSSASHSQIHCCSEQSNTLC